MLYVVLCVEVTNSLKVRLYCVVGLQLQFQENLEEQVEQERVLRVIQASGTKIVFSDTPSVKLVLLLYRKFSNSHVSADRIEELEDSLRYFQVAGISIR